VPEDDGYFDERVAARYDEVGVPDLQRLPPGETIRFFHVTETRWGLDEYDLAAQGLTSHHFEIVDGSSSGSPFPAGMRGPRSST
jgi:hypothetical protein